MTALLARYGFPVALVCVLHLAVLLLLAFPAVPKVLPPQVMEVVMMAPAEPAPPAPKPEPVKPVQKTEPVMPKPESTPRAIIDPVLSAPAAEPVLAPPPPVAVAPVEAEPVVVPPRIDASYRGNVAPPYPPASRRLGEEGRVLLRIFVNVDGSVGEVVLSKSSGYGRLDNAALQAVKRWKLIPARRGSEPFATWYTLPFEFNLLEK